MKTYEKKRGKNEKNTKNKIRKEYHWYSLSCLAFVILTLISLIIPTTTIYATSTDQAADGKALLTIDTVPIGTTDQVMIPVTTSLSEGSLHATTVAVNYDPGLLRPIGCMENPEKDFSMALCNIQFDIDGVNPDTIRFTAVSVEGISGDATLVELNFEVIDTVSQNIALEMRTLSFANEVGEALPVTIQNNIVPDIVPNILIFLPIISR